MSKIPSYLEELVSQIPALQVPINLDYEYLTFDEACSRKKAVQRLLTGQVRVKT